MIDVREDSIQGCRRAGHASFKRKQQLSRTFVAINRFQNPRRWKQKSSQSQLSSRTNPNVFRSQGAPLLLQSSNKTRQGAPRRSANLQREETICEFLQGWSGLSKARESRREMWILYWQVMAGQGAIAQGENGSTGNWATKAERELGVSNWQWAEVRVPWSS